MYQKIEFSDFCDGFHRIGRGDQFSYSAKEALFQFLTKIEDTGKEIEFDPLSLCTEWIEFDSALEAANNSYYNLEDEKEALKALTEATEVIELDSGGVLIKQF